MRKLILASVLALGLTGCVTPITPFEPANGPQQLGYSEVKIETGRYRIIYRGTDHPGAPAEDLALLHAADLTLAQGYDWFRVTSRSDGQLPSGPTISLGTGGANYGRSSAVGVGVGTSFNLMGGPVQRSITLEVLMEKGAPPHDPDAYDAHDAAKTIRARL